MMSDTYRYLPKEQKKALDLVEVSDIDNLIRHKAFGTVVRIIDTLAQVYSEGQPLSEDQKEVLLYPWKMWGRKAGLIMFEMRKSK